MAEKKTKSGVTTSEGWLAALVTVLSALVASGALQDSPTMLRIAAMVLAFLMALGYGALRTWAKK